MIANNQTNALVSRTLALLTKEDATRGEATQSLLFTLVVSHIEKTLPEGINILNAYRHTEKDAQNMRNNLFLTHLFNVMTVTQGEKGPQYKVKDDIEPKVISLLKSRLNRVLIVAAHVCHAYERSTNKDLDDLIKQNKNGLLSVRGALYFKKDELTASPDIATNWIALNGKRNLGSGQYEVLASQAARALDFKKQSSGTKKNPLAASTVMALVKETEDRANVLQSQDKPVSLTTLKQMQAAWVALGEAIAYHENLLKVHGEPVAHVNGNGDSVNASQKKPMTDDEIAAIKIAATDPKRKSKAA